MSSANVAYVIRLGDVMHEIIDGEAVIINLDQGTYYSLDGVGACVWERLAEPRSLESLLATVEQGFTGDRERMRAAIAAFLARLEEEKLIEPVPEPGPEAVAAADGPDPAEPFVEPVLQKYTDMEQLLLLDPIHEVQDSGWPNID